MGNIMVLVCHDLDLFSPRGEAVSRKQWRLDMRQSFKERIKVEPPSIVLHPYHIASSPRTWTAQWNRLEELTGGIQYYGTGNFPQSVYANGIHTKILEKTRKGFSIDFICSYVKVLINS